MPPEIKGFRLLGACDNYTPESSGGAEKAGHEIYQRLAAAGCALEVVSVPFGNPYRDAGAEVFAAKGYDLSKVVGGYLAISPQSFKMVRTRHRLRPPQALHANTIHYNSSLALARLARKSGLPFVVTAQVGSMQEMPWTTRTASAGYEHTIGRYILRSADAVLAVSRPVRDHMISIGADPERVSIVENGVDHERFACSTMPNDADPLVLSVGRLVDNKGPHLLVEAARLLDESGRSPRITFIGDGPMRSELEATVTRFGLADRVTFVGQVSDVEAWLDKSSIVVRPSFSEGLPLAVLEAMSAGRLNIVSDIAPNRELITNESNGLTFRTGVAADLANVLHRAVTDIALRTRLAAEGQADSRTRSWDRMAAETAKAITLATHL